MTADLVNRFASTHGISKIRAMVVISELLGHKKAPAGTEAKGKDMIPHFNIEELGWQ
jgi:hypothetical protein